jgi:hypothetical protein
MMRWLLLLLVVCAPAARAATTYFVSYASGSNANNGTSAATPWKTPPGSLCVDNATCATADSGTGWVTIQSGDTIQLKRGDTFPLTWQINTTWYPQSPASPVTLQDYGSGALPVIDGATDVAHLTEWAGSFAVIDAANNIYAFNFNYNRFFHSPGTLSGDNLHVFRNGLRWGVGSSTTNTSGGTACTSAGLPTNGMMYQDLAGSRVCVKAPSNPNSDGSTWRVGWRPYGILLGSPGGMSNYTVKNLALQQKGLVVVSSEFGGEVHCNGGATCSSITVDSCTVHQSGGSGIRNFPASPNANSTNWTVTNNTIDESFVYGLEFQNVDNTTPANWLFQNDVSHDNGDHGISASIADGITVKNCTFYRNAVGQVGCTTGPCGPQVQDRGNNMTFTGTQSGTPPGSLRVKDLDIEQNIAYAAGPSHNWGGGTDGSCLYIMAALGTNKIFNNVCTGGNGPGLLLQYDAAPEATLAFDIEGNTFGQNHGGGLVEYNGGFFDATHTVTAIGNLFAADDTVMDPGAYGVLWKSFPASGVTWNHNGVYQGTNSGRNYFCAGTVQSGACSGWSADVNADPLWIDSSASGRNFQLQAISPALNAGSATCSNITPDIQGTSRPQGAACDLGAYERSAVSTTTTSSSTSTTTSSTLPGSPVAQKRSGGLSGGALN